MAPDLIILAIAVPMTMALFVAIVLSYYLPLAIVLFLVGLFALRASWEEHNWILFAHMTSKRPVRMIEREKRRLQYFIAGAALIGVACVVAYQIEAVQNLVYLLRWLIDLEPST